MIYKSLDTLPITTFLNIIETQNTGLLISRKPLFWDTRLHNLGVKIFPIYSLKNIEKTWVELYNQYKILNPSDQASKILAISIKVDKLLLKYKTIKVSLKCLESQVNTELIEALKDLGYDLKDDYTKNDLIQVSNGIESLLIRVERLKKQLPENKHDNKFNIHEAIISYSSILGYGIKIKDVSVKEFFALQNQVKSKIKILEENGK